MPRRKIDKTLYTRLVEAFAKQAADKGLTALDTPNLTVAARYAGCSFAFAKKTWFAGWDLEKYPYAEPIAPEAELHREEMQALAAMASTRQLAEQERLAIAQQAMRGAAEAHVEEAKLIAVCRAGTGMVLSQIVRLVKATRPIAERAATMLETDTEMPPLKAVRLIGELARHAERCSDLVTKVVELERKHLGEPTERIEHHHTHSVPTVEEALAVVEDLEGPEAVRGLRQRIQLRNARNVSPVIIETQS